jgi:hypothetical protein
VEQKMTRRERRGTRNAMQERTLNREWGSKRKAWVRECHGGRNVEQEMTWREWRGTGNDM